MVAEVVESMEVAAVMIESLLHRVVPSHDVLHIDRRPESPNPKCY
jgi:hypothetical protein